MTAPPEWEIIGLGAFAGLTIFLGMPLARSERFSARGRAAMTAIASGILLFIFYDVLAKANALVDAGLAVGQKAGVVTDAAVLAVGLATGVVGLLAFESWFLGRLRARPEPTEAGASARALDPKSLATMVAVGIGLHNFSEGLAIGASFAAGALGLGLVLVIGFAIHNSTEGFGILGPAMAQGTRLSIPRLLGLGLVGGGPTLLGTVVGSAVTSSELSILFFGLAAGAILYVVLQLVRPLLAAPVRTVATLGLLGGFLLGYATDLVVTIGGG